MSFAKIKKNNNRFDRSVIFTLIFLFLSLAVFVYSLISSSNKVVDNLNELGNLRLNVFSAHIAQRVDTYKMAMEMGAEQIELLVATGASDDEISAWLKQFVGYIERATHIGKLKAYAIGKDEYTGRFAGSFSYSLDNISTEYFHNTFWFKKAIQYQPYPIFTPVYKDVFDNQDVITISISVVGGKGVLALDLYVDNIEASWLPRTNIFDDNGYILLDNNGSHIAGINVPALKNFSQDEFYKKIFDAVSNSKSSVGSIRLDIDHNEKFHLFFKKNRYSGYTSVVLIDNKKLFATSPIWHLRYLIILMILAIASIVIYTEENYLNKKIDDSNSVIDMLGNSYYAIYKVNIITEEYVILRGTNFICSTISHEGKYDELYALLISVLDDSSVDEFRNSFSIENIKNMAKNNQLDYSVDLRRLLEDDYKWVNLRFIMDKSISEEYVLLCFRECEEERKRELAHIGLLEDAVSALKESAESKRILYSSVSHDMRTPLNGIIGIAELMGHHLNNPEKIADYLEKIKMSGAQLITLIDNFLEMAKSESKTMEASNETFSISQQIGEITNIFTLIAQRDNKNFSTSINIKHDKVQGDLNKLMHILNNILSNAFKYTKEEGSISLIITEKHLSADNLWYQFIVTDNGIGMSQEFLDQIYTPFAREKRSETIGITGTGLGLSIVQNQVHRMEGEINIESQYGQGTTVTITLPFEKAAEEHKEIQQDEQAYKQIDLSGITVLAVEDNVVNMQILVELLSLKKIKVLQAWNGEEAVDMYKQSELYSIDAILMDIQMPVMDGLDAAKLIRKSGRADAHSIPIIALSANIFEEDIAESNAAGMDAHLAKPVNLNMLYATLAEFITKNKENIDKA